VFDRGERFIDDKLFAQIRLTFQPQVFDGILFRRIRRKRQAGNFPIFFGYARVLLDEKGLPFLPAMITGPIPEKE